MDSDILTPREVSKLLKTSRPWPYQAAHRGILPFYKFGKLLRFKASDIEEFIRKSRVE